MTQNTPENQEFSEDDLFKFTMEKKWDKVVDIYKNHSISHETKLTKSEETALHISVSSYHFKLPKHSKQIEQMIDCIEKLGPPERLKKVLSMQNTRGDTPLHLAAAVGWETICKCIASKYRELISFRNFSGETPLFIVAHHGKLQTFLCLHEIYNQEREGDESLCRRKDGNTILHGAISGEYFKLAYQIISYYPKLINFVNVDGESPLHVLARKPNVFKSSTQLGFYDSFIYYCLLVDELKKQKYNPGAIQNGHSPSTEINIPDNYRTCVDIFLFLWTPISKSFSAGFPWKKKQNGAQTDVENQRRLRENKKQEERRINEDDVFPPNYKTFILIFRFAMKVTLSVVGVGYWRIKKIHDKKVQHSHAFQILNEMIKFESRYKYDSNGQHPPLKLESQERIDIPDRAPSVDEHNVDQSPETNIARISSTTIRRKNESAKDQNKSGERTSNILIKDTPLLVAATTGIPEMVKKIISTWPVAIQDQDSNGKNVLLLTAENRQTSVFDYLIKSDLPEYMFHQSDNEGNSVLHHAAMLGELKPWRIPGAALQMQWEIKWYEHVKSSVPPLSFAHNNKKGETPRKIFIQTHANLIKEGNEWLIKTSESCSVVAALIATVAFATSATVPGGLNQDTGHPILESHTAFDIFAITSLVALCLAVTALVFFLAIITSRGEERDFKTNLPRMLLMGLTSLFASIAAMLVSFCAGHTFILRDNMRVASVPIYALATIPVTFFAIVQLPLYFDLLWAACTRVPLRSYKVFYH